MKSYFNFAESVIYPSLFYCNYSFLSLLKWLRFLFGILCFLFFVLTIIGILAGQKLGPVFGAFLFFCALFLLTINIEAFLKLKIKNPRIPENSQNIADYLSLESARIIDSAAFYSRIFRKNILNSSTIFYALVKKSDIFDLLLKRLLIDKILLQKDLENYFKESNPSEKDAVAFFLTMEAAKKRSQEKGRNRIEIEDIVFGLVNNDPFFEKFMVANDLRPEDIFGLLDWIERERNFLAEKKKFWEYKNLVKFGSIGKSWAAGYTITLDQYADDWSAVIQKEGYPEIIGYRNEIEQAEKILSSPEINNIMIVGDPGVEPKNIIQAIAKKSALSQSLPPVNNKRVVEMRLPSLLARMESLDKVEAALETIFDEVLKAGNIILVIDDFHSYVEKEQKPGAINISAILSPYLPYPQFQFIAITNYQGLHQNIELNPSLLNFFVKLEVKEPSKEETIAILQRIIPRLENRYRRYISYPAIKHIVDLCERYITTDTFPKKAKDVLNEAMVKAAASRKLWITPEDIDEIITQKTEIPVGKIEKQEKETLLNLEELIHQRIINQDEAVKEVSYALRRARSQIVIRKAPMGTFLFLGPTGVGKTETSKALAEIYFGSEDRIIRLDMSEFQNIEDISRLIGTASGQEGLLTTQVRENPFSLVLLDEIEKAHPNILNLFLQVLDEGHLTDGMGRKVDFRNTIIIATSNAGYKIILKAIKEGLSTEKTKTILLDDLFQQAIFRPEFINRFDAVVLFQPLTKKNLLDIVELQLQKIKKGLAEKNIDFIITPQIKERIVEIGYDITFGARNIKRTIQNKVEHSLAEAFLRGQIKRGDRIYLDSTSFEVKHMIVDLRN